LGKQSCQHRPADWEESYTNDLAAASEATARPMRSHFIPVTSTAMQWAGAATGRTDSRTCVHAEDYP